MIPYCLDVHIEDNLIVLDLFRGCVISFYYSPKNASEKKRRLLNFCHK